MTKKLSYGDVKQYIEEQGYTLLSKSYKNNHTKLKLRCGKGHEYKVRFGSFKSGHRCPICNLKYKEYINKVRYSYDYVKDYIESFGYTLLSDTYKNVDTKLKVKCPEGHEYEVTFYSFKKCGSRCSICSYKKMADSKRLSYDDVKSYIEEQGYTLLSKSYKNNHTKLKLLCPEGHEYKVKFGSFKNQGHRCPICVDINLRLSYDDVKQYIEERGYTLLSKNYKNNHTKLKLLCPEGHEYKVKFGSFKNQGHRCPVCNLKYKEHVDKVRNSYDYVKGYIEEQGYTLLSNDYKNGNTKLKVKCPEGHEYEVTFGNFQSGWRCPVCYGNKKLSYGDVKQYIEEQGYTLLSKSYKNNHTKLKLKCPKDHEYEVTFGSFKNCGSRCPICYADASSSKQEKEVLDFVKSVIGNNIKVISNDRTQIVNPLTGHNLELDIWIPELNKAIEYNGVYWHSFLDIVKKDKIKREQCKKLGIDLLIIEEEKWVNNQDLVMKLIENHLKGE